jgi:transcriptional regulator with GAF, ATPase, and Fis domain
MALQQLQWGAAWIEAFLRRHDYKRDLGDRDHASAVLELIATTLENDKFRAASIAVVTEMAQTFRCDRVSLGLTRRQGVLVHALSHTARFRKRMNVVRAIASAMDEAIDQKQSILFPVHNGTALHIAAAHGALARWGEGAAASILTIPFYAKEKAVGAFTFERSSLAFEQDTIDQIDAVVTVVGPLLELKRAEDRWLFSKAIKSIRNQVQRLTGPHHYRRKVAAAAVLALVGVGYFLTWD